jgi:L-aspartate oxidase
LVWGERGAQCIQRQIGATPAPNPAEFAPWRDAGTEEPDPALIAQDMSSIKHIMWNYVGLVRTAPRLARAVRDLRELESEIEQFYHQTRVTDGLVGLRNAVLAASIVAAAAWENKTSVGCHYRE